jgi:hypothetical protein
MRRVEMVTLTYIPSACENLRRSYWLHFGWSEDNIELMSGWLKLQIGEGEYNRDA